MRIDREKKIRKQATKLQKDRVKEAEIHRDREKEIRKLETEIHRDWRKRKETKG